MVDFTLLSNGVEWENEPYPFNPTQEEWSSWVDDFAKRVLQEYVSVDNGALIICCGDQIECHVGDFKNVPPIRDMLLNTLLWHYEGHLVRDGINKGKIIDEDGKASIAKTIDVIDEARKILAEAV